MRNMGLDYTRTTGTTFIVFFKTLLRILFRRKLPLQSDINNRNATENT